MAETQLAVLPGSAPSQRIAVVLVPRGAGRLAVELREQHHAEGIGWFDQRTLALDPRQLRALQGVLGRNAGTIEAAEAVAEAEGPALLAFPGPRTVLPRRPAAGEGA